MVSLDEAVIARLEKAGERFEVLVDPQGAQSFLEGSKINMNEIVAANYVFKDARKGDRASDKLLEKIFPNMDFSSIVKEIITKGHVQLTTQQKRKLMDEKRRQIVTIIARNAINPQTNLPHPFTRIERIMFELKIPVDIFKPAREQVQFVVSKLRPHLPIKFSISQLAIKIPPEFSGKIYGLIKRFGTLKKQEWQRDGSWIGMIELPSGLRQDFLDAVARLTQNQYEVKILKI
jgi:ribosome maturation protein SDO1